MIAFLLCFCIAISVCLIVVIFLQCSVNQRLRIEMMALNSRLRRFEWKGDDSAVVAKKPARREASHL